MYTKMKNPVINVVCTLFFTVFAFAQTNDKTVFSATEIGNIVGTTTTVQHIASELPAADRVHENPMGYVSLYIKKDELPNNWYTYVLDIKVTPVLASGQFDNANAYTTTLTLENNRLAGVGGSATDISKAVLNNSYGASVELIQGTYTDVGGANTPIVNGAVPAHIEMEIGFSAQTTYELVTDAIVPSAQLLAATDELQISWPEVYGAVSYDLEWTWIDNYGIEFSLPRTMNEIPLNRRDFELNNTRVQVSETQYSIPLIYAKGYLVYRVRAVGKYLENTSKYKYSLWSRGDGNEVTVADWNPYVFEITEDHEQEKNWQFQASYAEEGKKKEVISYFDGSLRNRQTVTKINSDNNTIVGEVVYDAQGRPAVEVLPVPVSSDELKYFHDFNKNSAEQIYSYQDFDKDNQNELDVFSSAKAMSDTNGASKYYSPNNDVDSPYKNRIPNAQAYPFSQIEYMPDNTGRIRRKSGVGLEYQLGKKHEMEYYYGVPEQKELNRLFGYSVGHFSHYKKNLVVDPNRQASVSYIDPQGRTIATALAGINPPNMTGLDDESETSGLHAEIISDLLGKLSPDAIDTDQDNNIKQATQAFGALDDQLIYTASKISAFDDARSFEYTVTHSGFEYTCENGSVLNYPLVFDLFVNVIDADGISLLSNNGYNQEVQFDGTAETFTIPSFEVNVPRGSYSIVKNLTVDRDKLEAYADDYITKLTTEGAPCYIEPEEVSTLPEVLFEGCFISCEECEEALITEYGGRDNYIQTRLDEYDFSELDHLTEAEIAQERENLTVVFGTQWDGLIAACNAPCDDGTGIDGNTPDEIEENAVSNSVSCNIARSALIEDMKPVGQYGQFPGALSGDDFTQNPQVELNIFNEDNRLFSAKIQSGDAYNSWRNPRHPEYDPQPGSSGLYTEGHYYNDDGTTSYVVVKEMIDEEENVTYNPEILMGVALIPVTDNPDEDEFYVEPKYLANVEDFLATGVWKDSWAESLLVYHPEYCYLNYAEEVCRITATVNGATMNSDGYDQFIRLQQNYDDGVTEGLISSLTGIADKDPYFSQQLASPYENTSLFNARKNLMNEALTLNYSGSGLNLLQFSYATVVCNSITSCNEASSVTLNSVNALNDTQKNEFWNIYKANYLNIKQTIQSLYANIYAKNNNCYNGCIGEENPPVNLISVIADYSSSVKNAINSNINSGTEDICSDDFVNKYLDKEKRFKPSDQLYDSGSTAQDVLADLEAYTGYEYYVQTGLCPLARDLRVYLEYFFGDYLNGGLSGSRIYTGQYLSQSLYEDLGGTVPTDDDVIVTNTISGNNLEINLGVGEIPIIVTLPAGSGYSWDNYGNGSWIITAIHNINPSYDDINDRFVFQAVAQIKTSFSDTDYNEIIIGGTTQARISNCSITEADGIGEYLGNGDVSGPLGDCDIESRFTGAFLGLLNELHERNLLETSVSLNNIEAYQNSYLSTFFGAGTALWVPTPGNIYTITIDGTQRFALTLNEPLSTLPVTDFTGVSFNYANNSAGQIVRQDVRITYLDTSLNRQTNEGTLVEEGNTLINFLCCGDINDLVGDADPDPCDVISDVVDGTFDSLEPYVTGTYNSNVTSGGWFNGLGSADSMLPYNTGTLANACPPSPQGGVFAGGICELSYGYQESFYTEFDVIAGKQYKISFYQSYVGDKYTIDAAAITGNILDETANWVVLFDGQQQLSPNVQFEGFGNQTWQQAELTFTATATKTAKLEFIAGKSSSTAAGSTTRVGYIGIDGIKVSELGANGEGCEEDPPVDICEQYVEKEIVFEGLYKDLLNDILSMGLDLQSDNPYTTSPGITQIPNYTSAARTAFFANTILNFEREVVNELVSKYPTRFLYNSGFVSFQFGSLLEATIGEAYSSISFGPRDEITALGLPVFEFGDASEILEIDVQDKLLAYTNIMRVKYRDQNGQTLTAYANFYISSLVRDSETGGHGRSVSLCQALDGDLMIYGSGNFSGPLLLASSSKRLWENTSKDKSTQKQIKNRVLLNDNGTFTVAFTNSNPGIEDQMALDREMARLLSQNKKTKKTHKTKIAPTTKRISELSFNGIGFDAESENLTASRTALTQLVSNSFGQKAFEDCDGQEEICIPPLVPPVSCGDKFNTYFSLTGSLALPSDEVLEEQDFCANSLQYLVDDYQYYLNVFGVTSSLDINYISITRFGATEFNYGYAGIRAIIDLYKTHVDTTTADNTTPTQTWAEFTSNYLETHTDICVPAPFPAVSISTVTIAIPDETPCQQFSASVSAAYTRDIYESVLDARREAFINAYLEHALQNAVETFDMAYYDKEYQYTLYYYDQAGNLLQTVPPEGVDRFTEDELNTGLNDQINTHREQNILTEAPGLLPQHDLISEYRYNTLNQLVWQKTPDGGVTRFAYDVLGRIVASQNAKQLENNAFSYTVYDFLGRITEAGELTPNTGIAILEDTGKLVFTSDNTEVPVNENFPENISDTQREVTVTAYTKPVSFAAEIFDTVHEETNTAYNSRNRVTAIYYYDTKDATTNVTAYDHAIFYNYDIHGNVQEIVQHNKLMVLDASNPYSGMKKTLYEYDLISGNVNKVTYQKGQPDMFIHRYTYDADNRIVEVETSGDGMIWEKDARYDYYTHGPLARSLIGDKEVQGVDYAYTLQGWLKGMNSETVTPEDDLGQDGSNSSTVAKDAMGYSLGYYDGDYQSIAPPSGNPFSYSTNGSLSNARNLYNGNIKQMVTALLDNDENVLTTQFNHYEYDQLNRIKAMQGYSVSGTSAAESYSGAYSYDRNGNLKTLQRSTINNQGNVAAMDDLTYFYKTKTDPVTGLTYRTNQLDHIDETINGSRFNDLIDQKEENYMYDAIGQLTEDKKEGIELIEWRADGKVRAINKKDGTVITFHYDGMGNRVAKTVLPENTTTLYERDAQGNVLAIYKKDNTTGSISLEEHHIYGSSRLGMEQKMLAITEAAVIQKTFNNTVGDKRYELSNHLGNVLSVVSDRKLASANNLTNFTADVLAFNDYYPFGMLLPNRHGNSADYRYGFQGQEMDNEIKGEGNHIAYAERGYDPRVGRWISVDAYAQVFAGHSPYNFALNNPIYIVDEEGNWPKPSELLPDDTSPFIKGLVDGVWEGLTGTVGFVWDYATDSEFREQVNASFKALINDPIGTLESIVDEYAGMIERLATGNATDEDIYNVGLEVGEGSVGILLGGSTLVAKGVKKLVKPKVSKGKIVNEVDDLQKVRKKHDPNVPSGFYDVRDVANETIYVGKGPSRRATQSLKVRKGDKVISYSVTEGVAGLNVRQTSFAFEELLLRKAKKANGDNLLNGRNSPGKKILEDLEKNNPDAYQKVREAFDKKMAEGGKEIKTK